MSRNRLVRAFGSFVAVVAVYWVYALVAVPIIEPSIKRRATAAPAPVAARPAAERLGELAALFPKGHWAHDNPKIVESEQVRLLIREYRTLPDGRMEIRPCAMIFTPLDAATPADRVAQSVVLEAANGAVLQFDDALELSRLKVGRLIAGSLRDQIVIRSQGKLPGPEDDLLMVTRDVEMSKDRVWTPHPVEFRLGASHGRGREMLMKLAPGEEGSASSHGPNIAGIERFEIRQLERLHLEAPAPDGGHAGGAMPGAAAAPGHPPSSTADALAARRNLPLEISCRGPFRYDPSQQLATFENQVDVLQINPNGPADQITCEQLSVYLARSRGSVLATASKPKGFSADPSPALDGLEPRRIEAVGRPVILRSPSQGVQVRGERLEYDVATQRIELEGQDEVFLIHGGNEIHARNIQYESAGPGKIGQVVAQGPGWFRAQMSDGFGSLQARWNGQLRIRPYEQEQVASLTGGAELDFAGLGKLTAGEIHFWMIEPPARPDDKTPSLEPDRMLARQDVRLVSPQIDGSVNQLEVWFEQVEESPLVEVTTQPGAPPGGGGPAAAERGPAGLAAAAGQASLFGQQFKVDGNLLRARVLMRGNKPEPAELVIEGNVQLSETRTARPGEAPMVIRGQRVHVTEAGLPSAAISVTGAPAYLEGRGLSLSGANVNLNRGSNRLWIDGPGQMGLPLDQDLQGQPLDKPQRLDVTWQQRMNFSDATARLEGLVVAQTAGQRLETGTMEVTFDQPVRFGEGSPSQPKLEKVLCRDGVLLENQTADPQGLVSIEEIKVKDLAINRVTGAVNAGGPGTMTSVRRGSAELLSASPKPVGATAGTPSAAPAEKDGLIYLNVRFQGWISGNLTNRQLVFHEQVRTLFGPVAGWNDRLDPDRPEGFGPQGAELTCDELAVTEMTSPDGSRRHAELVATGNTVVQGETYTARATRMSYDQAKGLLVLEGDGRSDVELYYQKQVAAPVSKTLAQKLMIWPATREFKADGFRGGEFWAPNRK